tara:strand:+ start:290 stop:931 length:642 start_codon:yes stop_codon:yes gene_type:complete
MIPARLGSQRLTKKNLKKIGGKSLIELAIKKAIESKIFDEIWINSESEVFRKYVFEDVVRFHKRPKSLADNNSTSEDYVYEFMKKHNSKYLIQLHTISPILKVETIIEFVNSMVKYNIDSQFSVVREQIECIYDGQPINFNQNKKMNSQDLKPVERITWSITGWETDSYIKAYDKGDCATYSGIIRSFPISREEGIIIKTSEDLNFARRWLTR